MKSNNILLFFVVCMAFSACSKNEIETFTGDAAGIYFQNGYQAGLFSSTEVYTDSLDFSFSVASYNATDTILYTRIRTMGKTVNYDRPVKLSVDPSLTTAVEGTHFEVNLDTMKIPAGQSEARFGVKFKRTADMLSKSFVLALKVEDNEYFKVYIKDQTNSNLHTYVGDSISADRFRFVVSEIYTRPSQWNFCDDTYGASYNFFGKWTIAKYKFINHYFGWTVTDWINGGRTGSPVQLGRFATAALKLQKELQRLADAGTPVKDSDGSFMQLGSSYQVDYSAYL